MSENICPMGLSQQEIEALKRLAKSGWEVTKSWIDYWANGKKVYIAELEKG